jgi:hypothetical protein
MLIGAEGARLLREYGAGETPQALSAEEAPRNAPGKRSAWSANQQPSLTQPSEKKGPSHKSMTSLFCGKATLFLHMELEGIILKSFDHF